MQNSRREILSVHCARAPHLLPESPPSPTASQPMAIPLHRQACLHRRTLFCSRQDPLPSTLPQAHRLWAHQDIACRSPIILLRQPSPVLVVLPFLLGYFPFRDAFLRQLKAYKRMLRNPSRLRFHHPGLAAKSHCQTRRHRGRPHRLSPGLARRSRKALLSLLMPSLSRICCSLRLSSGR